MSAPAAGSIFPLHPDSYGHPLGRTLGADIEADLFGESSLEPSEEHLDRLWAEEQQIRGLAEKHTHEGCGHDCESGACHLFAMTRAFLCDACEQKIWKHW